MVCACSIGMGFRSTPEQFSQHDDSLSSIEAAALLGTTTPHACISRCVFAVATWDRSSQRHNGDGGAPRRQGALAPAQFEIIVVAQAIAQRTGANADRCQGAALAGTTPDPRVHRRTVRQCAHDFSRRASLTRTLNRLASGTLITASLATRRGAKTPH